MREICVIGGNRYFGKRLIARLLESGDRVTVINRGSSGTPEGVTHLVADRDDEHSLRAALGSRAFDVVIDQVCYTPRQADIARRVFAGRTGRYVMTSTVEVYEYEHSATLVREDAVDPLTVTVDVTAPWDDANYREEHYGEGKRQAEAVLARDAGFPYVSVRVAHVLGGADDFTGRVDHYASRIRAGEPIAVPAENHPATYVYVEEIADFLAWTAGREFTGPVNANAYGLMTTDDICAEIERQVGRKAEFLPVEMGEVSPFSFFRSYGMDNSRAAELGYAFRHSSQWLPKAIVETLGSGATGKEGK
ncbi:NAD-dependent epimerase/dehydratase family protein [Streptomyces sp. NBC_00191]|uniref:NAD-dependent epimerase/dehydratase family protein n=1 Tax=Streptomyces sp. NBC_00191 TaxID=2975674 RepID=UPI003253D3EC